MFGLPEKLTPEQEKLVIEMMKQQVPALQTQAQYNAFIAGFDAFRFLMNAIFAGDKAGEERAKQTLDAAIDVARKVTEIGDKLRDVPEAASAAAASMFTQPPVQLHEQDVQLQLLSELEKCETLEELTDWYNATPTKERREKVVSQPLRNVLMDSIRAKRTALSQG